MDCESFRSSVHRVADRLRLVQGDGSGHLPVSSIDHLANGTNSELNTLSFTGTWPSAASHRVDVRFQFAKQQVVGLIGKGCRLEVGCQADMKDIRRLFRWAEGLRIRRASHTSPGLNRCHTRALV